MKRGPLGWDSSEESSGLGLLRESSMKTVVFIATTVPPTFHPLG